MAIPFKKINMGLYSTNLCFKRQMRFAFLIEGVTMYGGLDVKITHKAQRPNFSFKEIAIEHLTETIYMPGKIEFKPIQITLYDTYNPALNKTNPVFQWIESFVYPKDAIYGFASQNSAPGPNQFKKTAYLNMYDGSGCVVESWKFENAWPQEINFNEVDYSSNDVMSIDMTLRYDRCYAVSN
jgi:hypothetical protein